MAQVGISITMAVTFRGVSQEFSNVFHYTRPIPSIAGLDFGVIVDEIVGKLKSWHSTDVVFKRAAVWTSDGAPSENEMLLQKNLTGTGSQSPSSTLDRERVILVRWPAGKDRKGRPVYLRSYFHVCGAWPGASTLSPGHMQNTAEIDSASRAKIASDVNALKVVGGTVDTWTRCAASGRTVEGDAEAHRWLEHHQLGDQWR